MLGTHIDIAAVAGFSLFLGYKYDADCFSTSCLQAGWLANKGIKDASDSQLLQSLTAMQANIDSFLQATQQAGELVPDCI